MLNLNAITPAEERVKEYLESNASDILKDKINKGVEIEKDGKQVINKKTLQGFFEYAKEEARKQVKGNAGYACIEDKVVYGWAVHYFEEDNIIGTLYNLDGTELEPNKKVAPKAKPKAKVEPKKEEPKQQTFQLSLFDLGSEK